jgi:hypothetical protein
MVVEAGLITVEILKVGPAAQRAGREVSYQQLG